MKQDEVHDSKNKKNIQKLNFNEFMNQLIICITDFKNQQLKIKKSKTDKFKDKSNDNKKNEDKSEEKSENKSDKNDEKSDDKNLNSNSTIMLKNSKKNTNKFSISKNCNYCDSSYHNI